MQSQAAFFMAVFTEIGFGCQQDSARSQQWLQKSLKTDKEFLESLSAIKADMDEPESEEISSEDLERMVLKLPPQHDISWDHVRSEHAKAIYDDLFAETVGLESSLGNNHGLVLDMKLSILDIQLWRGQWNEAEVLADELISRFLEKPQSSRMRVQLWDAKSKYAQCLATKGNIDQAEEILLEIHDQAKSYFGEYHPVTITMLQPLTEIWMDLSRFEDVESILIGCFPQEADEVGKRNQLYTRLAIPLGQSYMRQDRYADAERVLLPALQTFNDLHGETDVLNTDMLQCLVELYLRMDRFDEAEEIAV
jgi:tetratricopeptide (TPR) repeat protein